MLLERTDLLRTLAGHGDRAAGGSGAFVFIGGEAGIGKSAVVAEFAATVGCRVLRGGCDGGTTPAPLGPLVDIADHLGRAVTEMLASAGDRGKLFAAARTALVAEPTVFVVEDVHWADEATLDLLRYLARRLLSAPLLIAATYRDDEIGPTHPLTMLLGDLATANGVTRVSVPPLSQGAVAQLAASSGADPRELYRRTGGNPFYATEVLAANTATVPPSVRDAVLARAARLSDAGREVVSVASVIGLRAELDLLLKVSALPLTALDECVAQGMLTDVDGLIVFRHELARAAIETALPAGRRVTLHAAVYQALRDSGRDDDRRLAHHASAAQNGPNVLVHAPLAAIRAAALAAHREAAQHYRAALRFRHLIGDREHALLLEALSYECYLTDHLAESLEARATAHSLWRKLGDDRAVGVALRWLSRLSWFLGRNADAERYANKALSVLEPLGSSPELAMAYSNVAQLRTLAEETDAAVRLGTRALDLARQSGDRDIESHALNNIGTALLLSGSEVDGAAMLADSLEIALADDRHEHAARAYTNLGSGLMTRRRLAEAERELRTGIDYCSDHDLDSWQLYMQASLARVLLDTGRCEAASALADRVLRHPRLSPVTRIPMLVVAGTVAVRRGQATVALDEALALAEPTGEIQRLVPVVLARAEAAWTDDRPVDISAEIDRVWALAVERANGWDLGQLAWFLAFAGDPRPVPDRIAEPFTLMLNGRNTAAAAALADLNLPWPRALALGSSARADEVREAAAVLETLGASATLQAMLRDVRRRGRPVPRGPRSASKANPAGLTGRELEVLAALADGLSNADIATQLVMSRKTVAHHVSAVLRKLGEPSRSRAVAAAIRAGIVMPT